MAIEPQEAQESYEWAVESLDAEPAPSKYSVDSIATTGSLARSAANLHLYNGNVDEALELYQAAADHMADAATLMEQLAELSGYDD